MLRSRISGALFLLVLSACVPPKRTAESVESDTCAAGLKENDRTHANLVKSCWPKSYDEAAGVMADIGFELFLWNNGDRREVGTVMTVAEAGNALPLVLAVPGDDLVGNAKQFATWWHHQRKVQAAFEKYGPRGVHSMTVEEIDLAVQLLDDWPPSPVHEAPPHLERENLEKARSSFQAEKARQKLVATLRDASVAQTQGFSADDSMRAKKIAAALHNPGGEWFQLDPKARFVRVTTDAKGVDIEESERPGPVRIWQLTKQGPRKRAPDPYLPASWEPRDFVVAITAAGGRVWIPIVSASTLTPGSRPSSLPQGDTEAKLAPQDLRRLAQLGELSKKDLQTYDDLVDQESKCRSRYQRLYESGRKPLLTAKLSDEMRKRRLDMLKKQLDAKEQQGCAKAIEAVPAHVRKLTRERGEALTQALQKQ